MTLKGAQSPLCPPMKSSTALLKNTIEFDALCIFREPNHQRRYEDPKAEISPSSIIFSKCCQILLSCCDLFFIFLLMDNAYQTLPKHYLRSLQTVAYSAISYIDSILTSIEPLPWSSVILALIVYYYICYIFFSFLLNFRFKFQ